MQSIVVDTSVWIDHFKNGNPTLVDILEDHLKGFVELRSHEMIIGELLLGGQGKQLETFDRLNKLKAVRTVSLNELKIFIKNNKITGSGIGYVDANLLASCLIVGAKLLTLDSKLAKTAEACGVAYR